MIININILTFQTVKWPCVSAGFFEIIVSPNLVALAYKFMSDWMVLWSEVGSLMSLWSPTDPTVGSDALVWVSHLSGVWLGLGWDSGPFLHRITRYPACWSRWLRRFQEQTQQHVPTLEKAEV